MTDDLTAEPVGHVGGVPVFVTIDAPRERGGQRQIVHFDAGENRLLVHPDDWDEFCDTVNITLAIAEQEAKEKQ